MLLVLAIALACTMSKKLILYSYKYSPPVRAVWLTARHIGLDLENVLVRPRSSDKDLTNIYTKMSFFQKR